MMTANLDNNAFFFASQKIADDIARICVIWYVMIAVQADALLQADSPNP